MPLSAYTTYVLHKDHKDLQLERVDSSRNLAQIDLQGFKAKNLRLGINGWHCQPTHRFHENNEELRHGIMDSARNLEKIFLQGFKAKTLRLCIKTPDPL